MNLTQDELGTPEIPVEEDSQLTRMPALTAPFAAFGAAAGLFAILALGAFRPAAQEVSPLLTMLTTAAVGAGFGRVLRRWEDLYSPLLTRDAIIVRVGILTMAAGALSGGFVGLATWGIDGFLKFFFGGAFVGLLFLPSCLVVLESAHRAGRGRHGSLVAETDRRTVHSTLLGAIAFAAATPVPAILNLEFSDSLDAASQIGLSFVTCLGATIAILVFQHRDRHARAALAKAANDAKWLDRVDSGEDEQMPKNQDAFMLDLGVGAEHWARGADANYRTSARSDVVLKGSIDEAMTAFEQCERRRTRSLIVAAAGLIAVLGAFVERASIIDW